MRAHGWVLVGLLGVMGCGGPADVDGGSGQDGGASAMCGDGVVGADEQCDDGNTIAFDGCEPSSCTFTCELDASCDDADACNGTESCDPSTHACASGEPLADGEACTTRAESEGVCRDQRCLPVDCREGGDGICDDGDDCTADTCGADGACVNTVIDEDGDGHASTDIGACGDDCDDDDPSVYAGAQELCESGEPVDNDCDPATPNPTETLWYLDCDGDGFAAPGAASSMSCEAPAPQGECGWTSRIPVSGDPRTSDCNDASAEMFPGQTRYFSAPHPCPGPGCTGDDRFANYNCNDEVDRNQVLTAGVRPACSPAVRLRRDSSGYEAYCSTSSGWQGASAPACGDDGAYATCSAIEECTVSSSYCRDRGFTPLCVGGTRRGEPCFCFRVGACEPDCEPGASGCPWHYYRCVPRTQQRTMECR